MTNCIKYWYLINFIFVFFPNLYNQFCNFYNTTWYNIKNKKKIKKKKKESKTDIKENLIIWIRKRNSKQNKERKWKEKNFKWNRKERYILSEHETGWKMKRKKELREFTWMEDKGEEEKEWEVNIMRVSVKGEERA